MTVKKLSLRTLQEMGAGAFRVFRNTVEASTDPERRERDKTMERWMKAGLILYIPQLDTTPGNAQMKYVVIKVGEYEFRELLEKYPSEQIVAEVGLAVHAGVDNKDQGNG